MTAGVHNITIEQGATFAMSVTYKDSTGTVVDITGYTARMQVRKRFNSTTALLDLTSAGGDITITGASGLLEIVATATATAALDFSSGVYDIEIESGAGVVTRLLQGEVTFSKEVTR